MRKLGPGPYTVVAEVNHGSWVDLLPLGDKDFAAAKARWTDGIREIRGYPMYFSASNPTHVLPRPVNPVRLRIAGYDCAAAMFASYEEVEIVPREQGGLNADAL